MAERVFNFSSGPAIMSLAVLERARDELSSFRGSGMSVMELSHRSDLFGEVIASAEEKLRALLGASDEYKILFMSGGASLHFDLIPMNLLRPGGRADHIVTGAWSAKALAESQKFGKSNVMFSDKDRGYRSIPSQDQLDFSPAADYVHYCSNETIHGVEFDYDLDAGGVPVICDASSNILSKPIDLSQYAMVYAGAQKNIGPSGVTVVIIREDLLERIPAGLPAMLDYRNFAVNGSMPNTPNTWGVYMIGLVCDWLSDQGGLAGIAEMNARKAALLYSAIDASDGFYTGHADRLARSKMNVTFRLKNDELDNEFCRLAESHGLNGLAGHRSVGGLRASIYNAFPHEGVEALIGFMQDFAARRG